ncbi:MAG: phenylalanine--tRNA ligase subunit beta [Actinomycetia bacterium]|nr:phenylalanine--tRNA ligase subunit beta [Actinomycetes bacterium]
MRVPISWLRDYVSFDLPLVEVAERIAVASAEVERIVTRGVPDTGGNLGCFVVGRVVEAVKHPNADRLQLCRVDTGDAEHRQIVCGAWNFGAGATVCVAVPGAVLPGGQTLERATLRGEVSDGMILAEDELELGTDHAGIIVLDDGPEPGTPLGDVLPITDCILEVEVTGNRPDLLSIYGFAREVAALVDCELAPPPGAEPPRVGERPIAIEVDDFAGCPRYIGRLFEDVEIGPSPLWLRARLDAAGVRAISNVVDVTNYVMLTFGSPLHAFDFDRLDGGRVGVRRARSGEHLVTLDDTRRALNESDLLITDASRAVALAGIMGGLDSEVADSTRTVLLEAANFEPYGILRSSLRLGLRSEGSNRWEKGVDPYAAELAATLATELIVELTGARYVGHSDVHDRLPPRPTVTYRPSLSDCLTGLKIPQQQQRAILERLGFDVAVPADADSGWSVTTPTWRARDVTREVDIVEEVARVHGLEKIPFTLPARRQMFGQLTQEQRLRRLVEDVMVGAGFSEAYTWSLVGRDANPDALRLPTPLSAEHAMLRTTLVEGLIDAARRNLDAGNERVALFEIARVYLPTGEPLPEERWRLGAIVEGGYGRAKGAVEAVHAALKLEPAIIRAVEPFLHPGKAAQVDSGWLGELHPTLLPGVWGIFELDLATLFAGVPERTHYVDMITYPAVLQDLAFIVGEDMLAGDLLAVVREAAGDALAEARVFDVYRGDPVPEGRKSLAVHVAFRSPDRTLSDSDARVIRERIVGALADRLGAELRSSDES